MREISKAGAPLTIPVCASHAPVRASHASACASQELTVTYVRGSTPIYFALEPFYLSP